MPQPSKQSSNCMLLSKTVVKNFFLIKDCSESEVINIKFVLSVSRQNTSTTEQLFCHLLASKNSLRNETLKKFNVEIEVSLENRHDPAFYSKKVHQD